MHASNLYHNPWTLALSGQLVRVTRDTGGMHDAHAAFLANSGTEANEAAIKFARKLARLHHPDGSKTGIVSFAGAFHGRTMGALSATPSPKYQAPFAPMVPGFTYGRLNDVEGMRALVTDATAGVIVEPIQGEGGVNVARTEFLVALAERCRETGATLVFDEIQCGLGRTGDFWAHTILPKVAHPHVITSAKALGNGIPVSAVIVNKTVADALVVGDHGTTFGGNPLASRVASHVVDRLADPALMAAVRIKEKLFRARFAGWRRRWPQRIGEARGRGLILGVPVLGEGEGRAAKVADAARERGLLVLTAAGETLRFVPPLVIGEEEIARGCDILEEAMASLWGES
jgi:acetylornithine aminotransferase